ncbi:MAG TPA: ferritin-like domain-containing protein [Planctomycetaceae bacterium]|nr:ferritin-like domain-containing protein [Planctomycetaceae bacterium]
MNHSPSQVRALRSDLIILLSQACELEHSVVCSLFYSACSLKRSLGEGITARQLELTERWSAELFEVALGKLLQFTQVWNLFASVGCNPYHWRPNFPIPANYYPTNLPIELLPFGPVALDRFLQSEVPDWSQEPPGVGQHSFGDSSRPAPSYRSIAQLYSIVYEIFELIPEEELLIGNQDKQVSFMSAGLSSLVPVADRVSAFQAIDLLRGGRASSDDSPNVRPGSSLNRSHQYDVLLRLEEEYRAEQRLAKQTGERFDLVRDVLENPVLAKGVDYRVPIITQPQFDRVIVGRLIQDPYSREVALLFEQVYAVILGLLQYVFRTNSHDSFEFQSFSETSEKLISRVLKPLAESLVLLPAGEAWGRQTAGPTFGMSRYTPLHPSPKIALKTVESRLRELILSAVNLERDKRVPTQLTVARQHLEDLLTGLREERAASAVEGNLDTFSG